MGAERFVALGDDCNTRPTIADAVQGALDLDAAARLLGVHYQTAYRWVRTGVLPAVKVGAEYRLAAEDVQCLADFRRSGQAVCYTGRKRDWHGLVDQFYRAAVAGDETGARRVFERLHLARVPMVDQCEQLVAPFARRLHAEFSEGVVLAGQVRLAAGICERQLHWATGLVRERSDQRALVLAPVGESHRLPVSMASAVLRAERWAVAELHGGVPLPDLFSLTDRMSPGLVVLSPTMTEAEAKDLASALGETLPVPILVGGPGAPLQELVDAASIAAEVTRGSRRHVGLQALGPPRRGLHPDEPTRQPVIQDA